MANKTIHSNHDDSPECPMDAYDGQWRLYSFRRDSIHRENPERFFPNGKPNIGLRRKMQVGLAFLLDYFEHSLGRYDIAGTGPNDQWDTSHNAGLLVWEHKPGDMGAKTYEARQKDAEAFLETYNNWMNG